VKCNKTYRNRKGRSLSQSSETIREQKFQNASTVHEQGKAAVRGEGVKLLNEDKENFKVDTRRIN
jgi:hypothetical protein